MRTLLFVWLAALALPTVGSACGDGGESMVDPTSEPIPAVTVDALYAVNGGDSSISVIDAASSSVIGTIQINDAAFPHHLYLSANKSEMFLAVPGMDLSGGHEGTDGAEHEMAWVLRLDAATGAVLAVAMLDQMNHNAIPSPDGRTVWTSQMMEPGMVLLLDATTLEVTGQIEVEDMPAEITFARDGSRAFVANGGSDDVSVADPIARTVTATIPVDDNPVGAWPGGDGRLYVDNEAGKSISALDPALSQAAQTYDLGFTPAFAATVGAELWVTDTDAGRVVFFDRASGEVVGEVATGAGAHAIALSPDGTRAWITNQQANTVSVIDTSTRAVIATVNVGEKPNGIAYRDLP
jgi:YVTN family beta-propeller protein